MRVCALIAFVHKMPGWCFLERCPWDKQGQTEVHGLPGEDNNLFDVPFKPVVFKYVFRMSSASVAGCRGRVEKDPGGTQSLLCCPELFISDPQQSKAPTHHRTQHLDSSLESKGYYSSRHLGHLTCHPPPQRLHPHAVPSLR